MHQSRRHERDSTIAPQEIPTAAPASDELTARELSQVVGGTDGPGNLGDEGTYETAAGRRAVITVPS